jgi:hypothetical protein
MNDQLSLGGGDFGRNDAIDVIVYDRWGRHIDTIPAYLGAREGGAERDGRWSLHAATLWAHLAAKQAERIPPTWAQLPCHDDHSPRPQHRPL